MAGVFPVDLEMNSSPAGHGYAILKVDRPNPFYPIGTEIKGHEFHYSSVVKAGNRPETCLKVERGAGIGDRRDGLVYKNCLALYTHIYAPGVKEWAPAIVKKAREYRKFKQGDRRENFRLAI
jgi:cobyrinic acid a,c-diamide synthase